VRGFYQLKNLGEELGWLEEKIIKEGSAFISNVENEKRKD